MTEPTVVDQAQSTSTVTATVTASGSSPSIRFRTPCPIKVSKDERSSATGLDRRHLQEVPGLFLDEDVTHVVHRHEAGDAPVLLEERHRQKVVLRDLESQGLPILEALQ